MGSSLRDILVCPRCQSALLAPDDSGGDLRCSSCQRRYPVVRRIPRFVQSDAYVRSFSFEWNRHRLTQLDTAESDESETTLRQKTGLAPGDVKGKLVLDVGCGMGRFAEVVSRWGGHVVACDLSYAVEAAHDNLVDRENVLVVQADLFNLPFPEECFDVIYSIGVLHHTPDCARAFRQLPRLLKPGGTLAVWVYGTMGPSDHAAGFYRRLTVRMPPVVLHALCYVAIPLYYLGRIPVLGRLLRALFPISQHPNWRVRVLDTFDWYAPQYQSKHTFPEVYEWFRSEGFTEIRLLDFPVAASAIKPERGRND